jgi:hypothetical protein
VRSTRLAGSPSEREASLIARLRIGGAALSIRFCSQSSTSLSTQPTRQGPSCVNRPAPDTSIGAEK